MPICQHCGEKWGWKQTMKTSFTLDPALTCPHCERKQFLTTKARRTLGLLNLLVPLNLLLPVLFDISPLVVIGLLFGTGAIIVSIHPFFVQLSNKEEPLW